MTLMDCALDHGALDIQERCLGHTPIQRIICERDQFLNLREALEEKFKQPLKASLSWQAKMPLQLDQDQRISVMKLVHALEDLDDVQAVWTNADEDLAQIMLEEEEE
jgi:transcriptional/translational regulatory protein YebC/TACO1